MVEKYGAWLASWATGKTIPDRVGMARAFLRDCGGLDGVSGESVRAFIAKPRADGEPKSRWSKATYYGHLSSLCEFLAVAGHIDTDPMGEVRKVKVVRQVPRPLTEADVRRVLATAEGDVRDWVMVALASGLRVSEIAKLRGEDVSTDGIYVEGKGGVTVTLPAHPDVLAIASRKPERGYWWPGTDHGHIRSQRISRLVGELFSGLGIAGSIHRCRHTYGTRLIRRGVHVRKVQQLMRHASLETTAGYTAVDEDELLAAVMLLPSSDDPAPVT